MRLVDFNPIGGSTSPLLFDWAELPYGRAAAAAAASSAAAAPAQAPGACEALLPSAGLAAVAEGGPRAGRSPAGATPAKTRGKDADEGSCRAPHAAQAPVVDKGGSSPGQARHRAACHGGAQSLSIEAGADAGPSSPAGPLEGPAGLRHGTAAPEAPVPGPGGSAGACHAGVTGGEIMFRVVTEPAGLRPGVAACRAPFDFADTGPGGAIDALLRKLQLEAQ